MEVQGAPEGRAPREITFRSLLTKDTYAEPNYLQCLHLTALQRSRSKELGRAQCKHWANSIPLAAQEGKDKQNLK